MITIDSLSADYLFSKSIADHKPPADIISEMVQERLVAAQYESFHITGTRHTSLSYLLLQMPLVFFLII
jgi:hypothetical protein